MPPKAHIRLHIVCWKSIFTSKSIKRTKYIIHYVVSEDTVGTVHYPIKLTRFMKSKSVLIIHSFSSRDIFSPAKFQLISVPIYFWRSNNRMPSSSCDHLWSMNKYFSDLLFLHLELFLVWDRQPSAPAIHLKMFRKSRFERRSFDDAENLPFYTI